jgi:hypothetical protein
MVTDVRPGARVDVLDLRQFVVVDDREVERDDARVSAPHERRLRSGPSPSESEVTTSSRIESSGRVRDLGELLREVVEQQPRDAR